jgi:tRNA dimethylallyltransferase
LRSGAGLARRKPKGELRPRKVEQKKCSYDLLIFGLDPGPEVLKRRMTERLDAMFAAGWIAEVRDLLARGYTEDDPGMKSTGYREIIQYLQELESRGSEEDTDAMQEALKKRILIKTRQYTKRQMAWWKGDERIRWIH